MIFCRPIYIFQALKNLKRFAHVNFINDLLDQGLIDNLLVLIEDKKSVAAVTEYSLDLLSALLNFKIIIKIISEQEQVLGSIFALLKTVSFFSSTKKVELT